jgi:hypothetical protein
LVIDPDALSPGAVALQLFQPMAWKIGYIAEAGRGIQSVGRLFRLPPERLELFDPFSFGESFRPIITVLQDHD